MQEKLDLNIIKDIEQKLEILADHLDIIESNIKAKKIDEGELDYVYKDNIDSNDSEKLLAAIAHYGALLERNTEIEEEIKMKENRDEKVELSRGLKNGYQIEIYIEDLRAKFEEFQKPVNEILNGKEEDLN